MGVLHPFTRQTRDREIVAALLTGAALGELAIKFDIGARRIRQIGQAGGVKDRHLLFPELLQRGGRPRKRGRGRPRLPFQGDELALYVKARRYYGAAYARDLVGNPQG